VKDKELCAKYVIGGEGFVWSELVGSSNLMENAWPIAGSVAERLWSSAELHMDQSQIQKRMSGLRCLLMNRGIEVRSLSGEMDSFSKSCL